MQIEIQQIIIATLYYYKGNHDLNIIEWKDVQFYIEMLEKKFNTKINVISKIDEVYEKYYETEIKYPEIKFRLTKYDPNVIDKNLIINYDEIEKLNNLKNKIEHFKEVSKKYPKINIDDVITKHPEIKFINKNKLFSIFMIYYYFLYQKDIDIKYIQYVIEDLKEIFNKANISIIGDSYINKSNNHKYRFYGTHLSLTVYDVYEYMEEATNKYNKEQSLFIQKVIAYYITSDKFKEYINKENDKVKKIQI